MALQFNRVARLRVGVSGTLEKEFIGLRTIFKFEKNLESNPNTGSISVYNLSETSRAKFEAKNAICSLDVGYGEKLTQIFKGNISKATTRKQGVDIITDIELGDGEKAYNEATIELSLPAGTTAEQALNKVTTSFQNVAFGGIDAVKSFIINGVKSYGKGITLSGNSKAIMDILTKTLNMEWSIQDGQIQVLEKNKPTMDVAFELTPETGLIGSPGKIKSDSGKNNPDGGIEFQCLLQPNLNPGRAIKIKSFAINGEYRITKVTHEGDNFSGNWLSKCEAYIKK